MGEDGARRRVRVDQLLVSRGLCDSRTRAQALIVAGKVHAGDRRIEKPGTLVLADCALSVLGPDHPFVSRGGVKLAGAIEAFNTQAGERHALLPLRGRTALDVGASTGGFTDCLLKHGVAQVHALDVGYGQLAWKLATDPRVVVHDRQNIRHFDPQKLGQPVDLVVVDCSFIALGKVVGHLPAMMRAGGDVIALVKPQFELSPDRIGRGGIVRDPADHADALAAAEAAAVEAGFATLARCVSPITGRHGNQEFFVWLRFPGPRPAKHEI